MNIQKLEALVASIDLGSFSRAAERLGYTQSGLTHMMNSLEAELGFAIIRRGHFGIQPTEDGERILPKIRRILAMESELREDIRRIRAEGEATVHIGACAPIAAHWLPSIVQSYRREYPGVDVEITVGSADELYDGLESGRLDLILAPRAEGAPCQFLPLYRGHLLAILPTDAASGHQSFPVSDLAGKRLLLPRLGTEVDPLPLLAAQSAVPSAEPATLDAPTVLSMVGHGMGIGILPALCVPREHEGVTVLPIEPAVCYEIGIAMTTKKKPSEAVRRFLPWARRFAEGYATED